MLGHFVTCYILGLVFGKGHMSHNILAPEFRFFQEKQKCEMSSMDFFAEPGLLFFNPRPLSRKLCFMGVAKKLVTALPKTLMARQRFDRYTHKRLFCLHVWYAPHTLTQRFFSAVPFCATTLKYLNLSSLQTSPIGKHNHTN